ncbi:MAG: deoxyribodipyrimidine photo-lyase, partial [Granulosicoccaceae bacterium]
MSTEIAIHWFRQDLRLSDNPSLVNAAVHSRVLPVYIFDDVHPGPYALGGASCWWLHHSLVSLCQALNGNLSLYKGDPLDVLLSLAERYKVTAVYWNRCYEPWQMERDTRIKAKLKANGIAVRSYNGSLLWEPWAVLKDDGTNYKVFTPFYRKGCMRAMAPREPLDTPMQVQYLRDEAGAVSPDDFALKPITRWGERLHAHWSIGERAACDRFQEF